MQHDGVMLHKTFVVPDNKTDLDKNYKKTEVGSKHPANGSGPLVDVGLSSYKTILL